MKSLLRSSTIFVATIATIATFGLAAAQQAPATPPGASPTQRAPAIQGGKPELTVQQRTSMYRSVMSGRHTQAPAGVSVRVGAKIPASVELQDVPESLHAEIPGVREYKYVVVQNQLVLVDPKTNTVLEIIQQ